MSSELPKLHNYDYYQGLPEKTSVELIEGIIYNMPPSPNFNHQLISVYLYREISNFLRDKDCKVFHAPFDVFLVDDNQDISECNNIVQPDIAIICDKGKFHKKGCKGTPDFIIEIVSLSTKNRDYVKKLNLYNSYGVREYWIVNPISRPVSVYVNEHRDTNIKSDNYDSYLDEPGFSEPKKYTFNDKVKVYIFDGLEINFSELELLD